MSDLQPDKNTSVFLEGDFSRKERKDRKAGGPTSVSATIDRSGWKRVRLGDVCKPCRGVRVIRSQLSQGRYLVYQNSLIPLGHYDKCNTPANTTFVIAAGSAGEIGYCDEPFWAADDCFFLLPNENVISKFLYYNLAAQQKHISGLVRRGSVPRLARDVVENLALFLPDVKEQCKIINALTVIDINISTIQSLIAKYEAIKKATVNLLLEPKAGWKRMKLDEICMCLDNYRKPVNEVERASMHGDIPYCGANGIVDYVNDFTIDDSIILIAEDGGYFDQYESRPIAYRMSGKAWINNHAHILKAKRDYCQDFIFYSLEHKDITPFITSGTRAKLTKGELSNIEIDTPPSFQEQRKIAEKIIAIDNALADYKAQLEKARQLKAGMMSYFFG